MMLKSNHCTFVMRESLIAEIIVMLICVMHCCFLKGLESIIIRKKSGYVVHYWPFHFFFQILKKKKTFVVFDTVWCFDDPLHWSIMLCLILFAALMILYIGQLLWILAASTSGCVRVPAQSCNARPLGTDGPLGGGIPCLDGCCCDPHNLRQTAAGRPSIAVQVRTDLYRSVFLIDSV